MTSPTPRTIFSHLVTGFMGMILGLVLCVSAIEHVHIHVSTDFSDKFCAILYDATGQAFGFTAARDIKLVYKILAFPARIVHLVVTKEWLAVRENEVWTVFK